MEMETTGVEVQEVAELAEESVETQEVAEPVETAEETTESRKTEADAAFAAQRRELQEAKRKIAEMEAEARAKQQAIEKLTGSKTGDVESISENLGVSAEDVLATITAEEEIVRKELELEELRAEVKSIRADKEMQEDLALLQKIDPEIKGFEDLGESFINYKKAGLSAEEAYYAIKSKENSTKATPAQPPGKVDGEPPEKDYFTEAEVDAMTEEQQALNWEKIKNSMKFWK